jgi:single-strand DNA-binding protein
MAGEVYATIVGNVGKGGVEMRFTNGGVPVCRFSVASTPRKRKDDGTNEDQPTTWYSVTGWRSIAENAAESLAEGDRVIVYGPITNRQWEDKEGGKRTTLEIEAYAIGPDLLWNVAKPQKGVHEGSRDRRPKQAKEDPFEGASGTRPAAAPPASEAANLPPQSATPPSDDW